VPLHRLALFPSGGDMETKVCKYCHVEKELTQFVKAKQSPTGYRVICKKCLNISKKAYVDANIEKYRSYQNNYRKVNGCKIYKDLDSRIKDIVTSSRRRRPFDFSIDAEYVKNLWKNQNGLCVYTKLPLVLEPNQYNTISIDRIDSSKGYIKGNTQLVCRAVNEMKMHREEDLFIHLCHLVSQHNKDKYTLST
jgi:hypothetical protein